MRKKIGPLFLKGQEALSLYLAHAKGVEPRVDEQDRVPSRLYRTVGIPEPEAHIIRENGMMAIREMAVAAVAAPMVMALGVVADRAETSRWVLLSSPRALARLGNKSKRRQTHIRIRAHWYTWHISIVSRRD